MSRPHPILLAIARGESVETISDPDRLFDSAVEHRMTGLLWSTLRTRPDLGPSRWRQMVASHDLLQRRRHAASWRALEDLTDLARDLDLHIATVKGVTAEARWYGRMGERPSRDIDLVLHPADLCRAEELVQAIQPNHPLIGKIQTLVDERVLQSVELRFADRFAVDLHFDLLKLGMPSPDPDSIWTHMVPYRSPNGTELLVPDPELALLHFLIHLTKDRFRYLLGYVDVRRLIEAEVVDWDAFQALGRRQGLDRHLWLALRAVVTVVPLQQTPTPSVPMTPATLIWRILWRPNIRLRGEEGSVRFRHRQDWLALTTRGHAVRAARYWLRRRLLPPRELIAYRHPDSDRYWWNVTLGRLTAARRRRRASDMLPQHGSERQENVETPSVADWPLLLPPSNRACREPDWKLKETNPEGPE